MNDMIHISQPIMLACCDRSCHRRISNLHHNVSENDIKELFSTCGQLKRHHIDFDERCENSG